MEAVNLLVPFLFIVLTVTTACLYFLCRNGNARRQENLLSQPVRVLFLILFPCCCFIWFVFIRFRHLIHFPISLTPEVLPYLAGAEEFINMLTQNFSFAALSAQWRHGTGIALLWGFWAECFGYTEYSYKLMQAVLTCSITATASAWVFFSMKRSMERIFGIAALCGSVFILGPMYRMKWHTLVPLVQICGLSFFFLGEIHNKKWKIGAFIIFTAGIFLYPGNIIHIGALSLYYVWKSISVRGLTRRTFLTACLAFAVCLIALTAAATILPGGMDRTFLPYVIKKTARHSVLANLFSMFHEIYHRSYSLPGSIIWTAGLTVSFLNHKKPINRMMNAYFICTAFVLLPTHGYENPDENAFIIVQNLWWTALGGCLFFRISFALTRQLLHRLSLHVRTAILFFIFAALITVYFQAERNLFLNQIIYTMSPRPSKNLPPRFQLGIALEDARNKAENDRIEFWFDESVVSGVDRGFAPYVRLYRKLHSHEFLQNAFFASSFNDFINSPPDGPVKEKRLYFNRTLQSMRTLKTLIKNNPQKDLSIEWISSEFPLWEKMGHIPVLVYRS